MSLILPRVLVALTCMAVIAWYMYTPLPDDMEEKVKVTIIDAAMRTYGHVAGLLVRLGVMEPFSDLDRYLADRLLMLMTSGRPWIRRPDPALQITDMETDKHGIEMRMYEPVNSLHKKKRPVLVYFHGGGFSLFSVDAYDAFTRSLARSSGFVVVSVNYRLSPQYPYPTPRDDCVEAVQYLLHHATKLGLDPARLAVGGDSAGGNLAASISITMKDRIKAQLLLVPVLQFINYNTTSMQENRQYFSNTVNNLYQVSFLTNYIGCCSEYIPDIINNNHTSPSMKASSYAEKVDQNLYMPKRIDQIDNPPDLTQQIDFGRTDVSEEFITKITNPEIAPLMSDNEAYIGLPCAYIMAAGYDIIRDDAMMYSVRIRKAGVPVRFVNQRTSFHNALTFVEGPLALKVARDTMTDIVNFLQDRV